MKELSHAYPKLLREWNGLAQRLRPTGQKGIPDYLLARTGRAAFTEVKGTATAYTLVHLDAVQADMLDLYAAHGLEARCLVLNILHNKWFVFDPPFMPVYSRLYCKDAPRSGMVLTERLLFG